MKKIELQPITLWSDQGKIDDMKKRLEALRVQTQRAVDTFFALDLPATENIPLATILNGSEALIQAYLRSRLPDSLNVQGLSLNKEKALSLGLVELEGRDAFNEALAVFKSSPDISLVDYLMLQDKTVIVNPERWEAFVQQNSVIVDNDAKRELYRLWKAAIDSLQQFNDYLMENHDVRILRKTEIIRFEKWVTLTKAERLQINHAVFHQLTRPFSSRIAKEPIES